MYLTKWKKTSEKYQHTSHDLLFKILKSPFIDGNSQIACEFIRCNNFNGSLNSFVRIVIKAYGKLTRQQICRLFRQSSRYVRIDIFMEIAALIKTNDIVCYQKPSNGGRNVTFYEFNSLKSNC